MKLVFDLLHYCIFILPFLIPCVILVDMNTGHGPYKTTVARCEKCKSPSSPYDKNPKQVFYAEIYNTSTKINLLRGNLTVRSMETEIKLSIKSYRWEERKWKISYMVRGGGCRGMVINLLKISLGIDQPGCVKQGIYTFKDVDFNYVQHKWVKNTLYGTFLWKIQIFSNQGTSICWEFETLTEQEKNK